MPSVTPTSASSSGLKTGTISYSSSTLHTLQQNADQGTPGFACYLDPFKVIQHDLPGKLGFSAGGVSILSPPQPPQPTPTVYANVQGEPELKITVQYQGKKYLIVLDQPETQGAQGIWVVTQDHCAVEEPTAMHSGPGRGGILPIRQSCGGLLWLRWKYWLQM